jgi:hypothetical protein
VKRKKRRENVSNNSQQLNDEGSYEVSGFVDNVEREGKSV